MKNNISTQLLFLIIVSFCSCSKTTPKEIVLTQEPVIRGYITNFNMENQTFNFDEIEWITLNDETRIKELGIENDMPNGFYIYNPDKSVQSFNLAENAEFYIITESYHTAVNMAGFIEGFHDYAPYIINVIDGKVVKVAEQYLP
jgi:hypothetical protein